MGLFFDDALRATAMTEDQERWERARPSLERNGFMSRDHGLGVASTETGHSLITQYHHGSGQWRLWSLHDSDSGANRKIVAELGPGDHDVGDRAMNAMRRPGFLQSMRDQMEPGAEADGTWPRRF